MKKEKWDKNENDNKINTRHFGENKIIKTHNLKNNTLLNYRSTSIVKNKSNANTKTEIDKCFSIKNKIAIHNPDLQKDFMEAKYIYFIKKAK